MTMVEFEEKEKTRLEVQKDIILNLRKNNELWLYVLFPLRVQNLHQAKGFAFEIIRFLAQEMTYYLGSDAKNKFKVSFYIYLEKGLFTVATIFTFKFKNSIFDMKNKEYEKMSLLIKKLKSKISNKFSSVLPNTNIKICYKFLRKIKNEEVEKIIIVTKKRLLYFFNKMLHYFWLPFVSFIWLLNKITNRVQKSQEQKNQKLTSTSTMSSINDILKRINLCLNTS